MKNVFILPFLLLCLLLNSCGGKDDAPDNQETIEDYAPTTLNNKSISLVLKNCDLADKVRFDIDKTLVSCQLSSGKTFDVSKPDYEYGKEENNVAFVYLEYFDGYFFYYWELTLTFKNKDSGTFEGLLEYEDDQINEWEEINGTFRISDFEYKESSWKNIVISKPDVSNITEESVVIQGTIEDKDQKLTSRGFSIGTSSSPKEGKHFECETNKIDGELTGLSSNTTYYVWLYAAISNEIKYGESVSFTTDKPLLEKVELSTPTVKDITTNSAVVTGNVYGNEGKKLSEIGICYGLKEEPTINDRCLKSSSDNINITLNELEANTAYYVRLYAKYNGEVKYGKTTSFSTEKELEIDENICYVEILRIYSTGRLHFSVKYTDEDKNVDRAQGVCYSTSPNPTITDYTSTNSDMLSGLNSGTVYYIRPYFIKNGKVHYYKETSFETIGDKMKLSVEISSGHKKGIVKYSIAMDGTYEFKYRYCRKGYEYSIYYYLGYVESGSGSFEFNIDDFLWDKYDEIEITADNIEDSWRYYIYELKF